MTDNTLLINRVRNSFIHDCPKKAHRVCGMDTLTFEDSLRNSKFKLVRNEDDFCVLDGDEPYYELWEKTELIKSWRILVWKKLGLYDCLEFDSLFEEFWEKDVQNKSICF